MISAKKSVRNETESKHQVLYVNVLKVQISPPEQWEFFYRCYETPYFEHRSTPYLTLPFFQQLGRTMPQNILLVLAYVDDQPVAAALNIYDKTTLYGR